ncbi:hypothetical protein C3L33_18479, partial [Rhododendron williamsianum]
MTLYNSGVPGTYFPLRKGGKVTLYQDAHVQDGCLPNLRLDHDIQYKHGNCWCDIFDAISQACRLIYNTGWSVYHQVRLVRENDNAAEVTLGDLLKTKSQQGVRVLLLVWNDPTSWNIMGCQQQNILDSYYYFDRMDSCKQVMRKFDSFSSILQCKFYFVPDHHLEKDIAGSKSRLRTCFIRPIAFGNQEAGTIYTHHQKTVIVDADACHYKREIIAFVGGLDLCKGKIRYSQAFHLSNFAQR